MLTVAELIAELQKYDPGLQVSVSGYEEGVTDGFNVGLYEVILNANTEPFNGEHDVINKYRFPSPYEEDKVSVRSIISRT